MTDWLNTLNITRRTLRRLIQLIDSRHAEAMALRRQTRKLIMTGNRFDARRAERLDLLADGIRENTRPLREVLMDIGGILMRSGPAIDAAVPQSMLLDFLSVNQADRHKVGPDDGFINLCFVLGLEYSATTRGDDFKSGVFFEAILEFMQHELTHNEELMASADAFLFGPGGMLERIPRYTRDEAGNMKRLPPTLRLIKPQSPESAAA